MPIPSLRDRDVSAETIRRFATLRGESKPAWGRMSAAQMAAHCQFPLRAAFGELDRKRGLMGILFGRMAKRRFIDGDAPFGRNSPTDPAFLVPGATDFDARRAELVALIQRFQETGATAQGPHPFFGPLTAAEWDRLMWKHLDHHLRQFGA